MSTEKETAYSEIVRFLTSGPSAEQIMAFTTSRETRKRVRYLMSAERAGMLTESEYAELAEYYKAEDFMRQLKIRARRKLPLR